MNVVAQAILLVLCALIMGVCAVGLMYVQYDPGLSWL